MPIFLSENENKQIQLSPKTVQNIQQGLYQFDNIQKNTSDIRNDISGVKQARHVVGTNYRTDNKNKKEGQISRLEAERIINHDKTDNNKKSIFHQLFDDNTMLDIKSKVKQQRTAEKPTQPQKDNNKTAMKPSVPSVKKVTPQQPNTNEGEIKEKTPNGKKIHITENQLKIIKNLFIKK